MSETQFAPIEVYLTVDDGEAASRFYQEAFHAVETYRMVADDGVRLLHCNLSMFGGQVMLADEFRENGNDVAAPTTRGGASVTIHVNLATPDDVDKVMARAAAIGATITMTAEDMPWGMRYGRLRDPFGHVWSFGAALPTQSDDQSPAAQS